jgi:transposase
MSMHPHAIATIPEETVRVARAAFPRGNIYLTMRDQLGTLYEDENFAALFPKRGRPAEARLPTRAGLRVPICGRTL